MSLPHRRFRAEHLSNFVEKVVKPFRKAIDEEEEQLRREEAAKAAGEAVEAPAAAQ